MTNVSEWQVSIKSYVALQINRKKFISRASKMVIALLADLIRFHPFLSAEKIKLSSDSFQFR